MVWDAGMAGSTKVDIISVVSLDRQLVAMAFPQVEHAMGWKNEKSTEMCSHSYKSLRNSSTLGLDKQFFR